MPGDTPVLLLPFPTMDDAPSGRVAVESLALAAEDRLASILALPRTLAERQVLWTDATVGGTVYGFNESGGVTFLVSAPGLIGPALFRFDPADYPAIGTLTPKLRLRAFATSNGTSPLGTEFTARLTRVTSYGGAADTGGVVTHAPVAGMDATVTVNAANQLLTADGAPVALPVAGLYALAWLHDGVGGDSAGVFGARLELVYG